MTPTQTDKTVDLGELDAIIARMEQYAVPQVTPDWKMFRAAIDALAAERAKSEALISQIGYLRIELSDVRSGYEAAISERAALSARSEALTEDQVEALYREIGELSATDWFEIKQRLATPELIALGEAAVYWERENELRQNTMSADVKLFRAVRAYAASVSEGVKHE